MWLCSNARVVLQIRELHHVHRCNSHFELLSFEIKNEYLAWGEDNTIEDLNEVARDLICRIGFLVFIAISYKADLNIDGLEKGRCLDRVDGDVVARQRYTYPLALREADGDCTRSDCPRSVMAKSCLR
jgi:hypothetical protein